MTQRTIRGGRGLGDSLYLRPIAEYFLAQGDEVTVLSDYPQIYTGLKVEVKRFTRFGVNVLAHYVMGKSNPLTTQWDDVCASAGVSVPLRFTWNIVNHALVDRIVEKAKGRPIIVVHGGRVPMGRTDGFGLELLPDRAAFEAVLAELKDCFTVLVGGGAQLYPLEADFDLNGKTSVSDLLDIASVCDGVVAQCSFAIPLAEVFDKPLLIVWAAHGLVAREPYVRQITPMKVLSKPTSHFVVDDRSETDIRCVADAWKSLFEARFTGACA